MTDISRETDDDGMRRYDNGNVSVLSVTTILGFLDEDTTGLEYWKDKNDGKGDSAYWQHLFWYSRHRGTLCHYQALKRFEDFFDGDDMWTEEESFSLSQILNGPADQWHGESWGDEVPSSTDTIAYSVMKRQDAVSDWAEYNVEYPDADLIDILSYDVRWFDARFEEVCDLLGITDESVIAVEQFLVNEEDSYGGQTDLIYEAPDGAIVVADLKTSSSLRQKHRLQAVAYAKAVEKARDVEVDRVEVIRITPDKKDVQVHSHEVPEHGSDSDIYTADYWFEDKYGDFEYSSLEDMWHTFKELTDEAKQV